MSSDAFGATPSGVMAGNANAKIVRLHFKCRGLADLDTFSKSDPYVVLYSVSGGGGVGGRAGGANAALSFAANQHQPRMRGGAASAGGVGGGVAAANALPPVVNSRVGMTSAFGREIGRTEIIMNNLNPVFVRSVDMQFLFESKQELRVVVFDDDGHTEDTKNDLCGSAEFQLSQVICSSQGKKEFPLVMPGGKQKGFIEISYTDLSVNARDTIRLGFSGAGLPSGGFCSGSNPFYTISRFYPNGSKTLLHRSEVMKGNPNPKWAVTPSIPLHHVMGSSESEVSILFELFNKGTFGVSSLGSFTCSVDQLENCRLSRLALAPRETVPANKNKNNNVPAAAAVPTNAKRFGDINVESLNIARFPTFASSLSAGWQINMAMSIDFTGSNGDPRDQTSLHYMSRSSPNQYVSAMMSVGDILMEYDSDKMIPVYGFGAHFKGTTSHFFNVNQNPSNPNVFGIQGALDAYGAFLPTVTLSGPTNFAPTIRAVTAAARAAEAERVYTILLIITDGEISDMRYTVDALVDADDAPLSIVIVGVGAACDFKMMEELDGDDTNLRSSNGKVSRRDLVQFVPYREFAAPKPREALAAEVLREIPDQFEEYLMLAEARMYR